MTTTILTLPLGTRSYDIVIGADVLARAGDYILPLLASPRAIIVTDAQVGALYAALLVQALREKNIRTDMLTVAPGEGSKSFAVLEGLLNNLLACSPDRKTTILALGGGVVGDLAGFAASILLRGVPFIQIPTSLLAQVDSSVGGKTAVNAQAGKNLIGSFYQPKRVLADISTLATLPVRELQAGYAEIIKYGLIMDADFYRWCLANGQKILARDIGATTEAVQASCRMKAQIVGADELESADRALLNFGHTFGHALEAETGYGSALLHGEAVAIGMVMACRLSAHMGTLDPAVETELATHLKTLGMKAVPRDVAHPWQAAAIAAHFVADKKAENGTLTFILLDEIGRARVAKGVDAGLANDVVTSFMA